MTVLLHSSMITWTGLLGPKCQLTRMDGYLCHKLNNTFREYNQKLKVEERWKRLFLGLLKIPWEREIRTNKNTSLNFQRDGIVQTKKSSVYLLWRGMDIFWNNAMVTTSILTSYSNGLTYRLLNSVTKYAGIPLACCACWGRVWELGTSAKKKKKDY